MDDLEANLLRGTLDLLILKALSWGPRHGYAVVEWIEQATDTAFLIGEGTLYPALHRLEGRGWITAEWGVSDNNRQAKYYRLAPAGPAPLPAGGPGRGAGRRPGPAAGGQLGVVPVRRGRRTGAPRRRAGAELMARFRLNLGSRRVERDVD